MQQSLGEFIAKKLTGEAMNDSARASAHSEVRNMRQNFKLPESTYFTIVFRAFCQEAANSKNPKDAADRWSKVDKLIDEKNS